MATEQEKEELLETLKFTPRSYRIELCGYGGEIVIGHVDRKVYEYFKENNIDIENFADDWDGEETDVPEEYWPFEPGAWHHCDDICHQTGVELSEASFVTVYDENNNEVWSSSLDLGELYKKDIDVEGKEEIYINDFETGTCVYLGESTEKGLFFEGEIYLTSPFDPSKLSFEYCEFEDWTLVSKVAYEGEEIEGQDMDTTGKGLYHTLVCVGEDE